MLLRGRFCNIDRRDDAVTRELLREWKQRPGWTTEQKVVLAAALRFTSSRRGGALQIGGLVDQQTELKPEGESRASGASSALTAALLDGGVVACGTGTYQMTLSRAFSAPASVDSTLPGGVAYTVVRVYEGSVDSASSGVGVVNGRIDLVRGEDASSWAGSGASSMAALDPFSIQTPPIGYFVLDANTVVELEDN